MDDKKETQNEQASFDPSPNTEFLREKIKQKPINKKKLIRRTLITVLSAAIFGLVACVTFIFLEPVISNQLNQSEEQKETGTTPVTLSEADESDEISPEDMYANDTEMIEEAIQGNVENVNQNIQNIENMVSNIEFGADDYQNLYSELRKIADQAAESVVTVTGVTSEPGELDNTYEDSNQISGLIVADNGLSRMIFVRDRGLSDADDIRVRFSDGSDVAGHRLAYDPETGYMIITVLKASMSQEALDTAVPATLGSSRSATLKGTPVIAVGAPTGTTDSLAYGMITSGTKQLDMTDEDYCTISTDIAGNENSSGVIVSLRGNVIGIIDNSFETAGPDGMITVIGITELKPLIEKMSNSASKAYLGIQGVDITQSMKETYGLPDGIYISAVELDSPAMSAGLQTGDVLVSVNGTDMNTYHDLISWLNEAEAGSEARMTVKRKAVDDYVTLAIPAELGSTEYSIANEEY